jgi:hypothetical protein
LTHKIIGAYEVEIVWVGPIKVVFRLEHRLIAVFSRQIAKEKIAVPRITIVREPNLRADCQRPEPPAWFVLGLRAGVGNPRNIGELIANEIVLWWQSSELERGS